MAQRDLANEETTRILIADGDRESRLAITWCLLSEGYRIDPVSDGFSAAAALEQAALPTIAIIDLGLQGFGGRRLIEHIHSSPRLRSVHIIATGFIEPFAPLPAGVFFLKKPCNGDLLLRTIRSLCREDLRSFFPSRREQHVTNHPGSPGGARPGAHAGPHPAASHAHALHGSAPCPSTDGSHPAQSSRDREQGH